jgi:hypothetical protein
MATSHFSRRNYTNRLDLSQGYFYDDFFGSAYNARTWSLNNGTFTALAANQGGIAQLQAGASANASIDFGNQTGHFSVAGLAEVTWRFKIETNTNIHFEIGVRQAPALEQSDKIYIQRSVDRANSNWWCLAMKSSVETAVDTGIASDTNWHEGTIKTSTGNVDFYLDGVLVANITSANIPTGLFGPALRFENRTSGTRNVHLDWVEAKGIRE